MIIKLALFCAGFIGLAILAERTINMTNDQVNHFKVEAHGIEEHGLAFITPLSQEYEQELKSKFGQDSNILKTYLGEARKVSCFIKNISKKAVVGYKVKWVMQREGGKTFTHTDDMVLTGLFMGGEQLDSNGENVEAILPGRSRLVSYVPPEAPSARSMQKEKIINVTISLEGAFFEDGSFVGKDGRFFEQVEAEIRAKHDLLMDFKSHLSGNEIDSFLKRIEARISDIHVQINESTTTEEFYAFMWKIYAQEILRVMKIMGKEKAVEVTLTPLQTPWIPLNKVG
jgi:hypothetical protein